MSDADEIRALRARVAELEEQLRRAEEELARHRATAEENEALKERVAALHQEIITLRPPRLPQISGAPRLSSGGTLHQPSDISEPASVPSAVSGAVGAVEKKEQAPAGRLIGLGVAFAMVMLTGGVMLLDFLQAESQREEYVEQRGLAAPTSVAASDGGPTPVQDAGVLRDARPDGGVDAGPPAP